MECAGKGSRTPCCCGLPTRLCHRCRAVAYCSPSHQVSHWSLHKRECERLKQQMKSAVILNDFPFTFTEETTRFQETRCSVLIKHGIHRLGMWTCECSCGILAIDFDDSRLIHTWNLSSELCPCKGPSTPVPKRLTSWKEYYEWRHIPLYSPAALLLHWPLTVYWGIQLTNLESLIPQTSNELRIHYLGPEKELHQLAVFGELHALFPGVRLHIELVGPAISKNRDGEIIDLCNYAQCNQMDCQCKYSVENPSKKKITHTSSITLRLRAGCYHDCYKELTKDFFPHIIIAPNAGIAAYMSWLPTLEIIREMGVPIVFSDYCEEASNLAASCIQSVTGFAPKIPIQINPFRQPLQWETEMPLLLCDTLKGDISFISKKGVWSSMGDETCGKKHEKGKEGN